MVRRIHANLRSLISMVPMCGGFESHSFESKEDM